MVAFNVFSVRKDLGQNVKKYRSIVGFSDIIFLGRGLQGVETLLLETLRYVACVASQLLHT